jgi:hypothetical protein
MERFQKATDYLAAWIRTGGRFDLNDLCDRTGCTKELEFLRNDLLELLADKTITAEAYEIYSRENAPKEPLCSDWLKELTERYFG